MARLVAAAILATGCATIFTGTHDTLTFDSNVPGVRLTIDGMYQGELPITFEMSRNFMGGKEFLARLEERTDDRDKALSVSAFRAQLKAINRWGHEEPADLARIHQPVLAINGESDRMVPSKNTVDLGRRVANGQSVLYPDAGHGGVFQFHEDFVKRALEFLS